MRIGASSDHFVYLRKSKEMLAAHLTRLNAEGQQRDETTRQQVLEHYDRLDQRFRELADHTIECTDDVARTAATVRALQHGLSAMEDGGSSEVADGPALSSTREGSVT